MANASEDNVNQFSFFSGLNKNDQIIKYFREIAPIGIALIDPEGYYIKVNPKFADSIGYAAEEVAGMHPSDITCPLFFPGDSNKFSKLVNREIDSMCIRKQYFKRNGEAVDVRVDVFFHYKEETDSLEFIGFYQKCRPFYIKYLPMVNKALQSLVDDNPSPGILIADQNGRILFGSRFAACRLGYSEMDLGNKSLTAIFDIQQTGKLISMFEMKVPEQFIESELKFHHRSNGIISIKSQIFFDDTNIFRNERMLVIVFIDKPEVSISQKHSIPEARDNEFLLEVKKFGNFIQSFYKDVNIAGPSNSDIRLTDYELTARERDVLSLFLERKNTKEIAYDLGLAEITIRKHFTSLYKKFGVSCREDLLLFFHGKNII